jgi:phospholipase/carboxylesterase
VLEGVELETGADARATVLWLHGLGADGHDFEPVVPHLGLPASLGVRFLFPHAPRRPVTINNGYVMRAWYDVAGFDRAAVQDEAGMRESAAEIEALIGREAERGVPPRRLVLAGFSQGGAMALHAGLRFRERLAGILGLSCYLPLRERVGAERSPANVATPVLMAHGTYDQVIPLAFGEAGCQGLAALGQPIEWQEYPIGHEVTLEEIAAVGRWLGSLLTEATAESP